MLINMMMAVSLQHEKVEIHFISVFIFSVCLGFTAFAKISISLRSCSFPHPRYFFFYSSEKIAVCVSLSHFAVCFIQIVPASASESVRFGVVVTGLAALCIPLGALSAPPSAVRPLAFTRPRV